MTRPPIGYQALRKGRVSEAGRLYFLTKVTNARVRAEWSKEQKLAEGVLLQQGAPEIIFDSLSWLQEQSLITLIAYCLMPDHLHLLIQLGQNASLSNLMRRFGSYTGLQIYRHTGRGHVWMDGFQDHALRGDIEIADIVHYIEYNPVKAKLVEHIEDWPWCSYQANRGAESPTGPNSSPT